VELDVLVSDCPDCLVGLRQHLKDRPVLLVTAYGSFLEAELARPLSRATLHQALQQALRRPAIQPQRQLPGEAPEQFAARVLLVEDNPVNQLVARGLLQKLGCRVRVAADGQEALDALAEEDFELVLMDCNMPVMDGYEATRRIRQQPRWKDLPVIALTANALPDERERCRLAGMDDYLAKPFHRDEMAAMLERWAQPRLDA